MELSSPETTNSPEKDVASEIYNEITETYPFLNPEEEKIFHEKVEAIETENPVEHLKAILKNLDNPHAILKKKSKV